MQHRLVHLQSSRWRPDTMLEALRLESAAIRLVGGQPAYSTVSVRQGPLNEQLSNVQKKGSSH